MTTVKIEELSGTLKHVLAFINRYNLNIYQVVISREVRNTESMPNTKLVGVI